MTEPQGNPVTAEVPTDPGSQYATKADVHELTESIETLAPLAGTVRRSKIALWLIVPIVIVLAYFGWRTGSYVGCVTDWANATASRSNTLNPYAQARNDALFSYLVDASKGFDMTPAQRTAALARLSKLHDKYPKIIPDQEKLAKEGDTVLQATLDIVNALNANDIYNRLAQENPVPSSPSASCDYWI